jgi:hypothetical protein
MYRGDFVGAIEAVADYIHEKVESYSAVEFIKAEFRPNNCLYVTVLIYDSAESPSEKDYHVRSYGDPERKDNYVVTLVQ